MRGGGEIKTINGACEPVTTYAQVSPITLSKTGEMCATPWCSTPTPHHLLPTSPAKRTSSEQCHCLKFKGLV